jgi:hypothetical protein
VRKFGISKEERKKKSEKNSKEHSRARRFSSLRNNSEKSMRGGKKSVWMLKAEESKAMSSDQ